MNTNTEENNSIKSITSPLSKVIRLPISKEEHEILMREPNKFRKYIDEYYLKHPELFPKEMEKGYHLHGYRRVREDDIFKPIWCSILGIGICV